MKFVMSYSGGKDSILALHHMVAGGHEPLALLVAFREEAGRSWVHGMDPAMLTAVSYALGIPLMRCNVAGATYGEDMEAHLRKAKAMGAEACVFGDIDIEDHCRWDEARCSAVGMKAVLSLWKRDREENVQEVIDLGYRCLVKCIQTSALPNSFLRQPLTCALLEKMRPFGVDLCGENGEYHTLVVDGPIFRHPVEVENKGLVPLGHHTAVNLTVRNDGVSGDWK